MFTRLILVPLAVVLFSSCDARGEITEEASFTVDKPNSPNSGSSNLKVCWATESIVIATARNKQIQAFDVVSGKEVWSKKFDQGIDAITCDADHIYVALEPSVHYLKAEAIRRLDVVSGTDSTPKGIPQPFLARALVWSPELKTLGVYQHKAFWIYSSDLLTVKARIPYPAILPVISCDGKSALLGKRNGGCSAINLKTSVIAPIHVVPSDEDRTHSLHGPFLSNAFYLSSGPLIRVIDHYTPTGGSIYFHETAKSEAKEVNSGNAHAVAAVHWPTKRLAVSGTSKSLQLFSTTGALVGKLDDTKMDRTYSLAFSPSGSKIAVLSVDGSIKIFSAN